MLIINNKMGFMNFRSYSYKNLLSISFQPVLQIPEFGASAPHDFG